MRAISVGEAALARSRAWVARCSSPHKRTRSAAGMVEEQRLNDCTLACIIECMLICLLALLLRALMLADKSGMFGQGAWDCNKR
eukprot:925739-Pelagomonas_calceolata.AAC.1